MARALGALALVAACLLGCSSTVDGHGAAVPSSTGTPPSGPSSGSAAPSSAPSSYTPPPDHTGYSVKPLDQLQPLPNYRSPLGCGWLSGFRSHVSALHPAGTATSGSGCQVLLPGGEIVQVRPYGPYNRLVDVTSYLKAVTVHGLEGRLYSFVPQTTDKICSVELDTRSLTGLGVDSYNSTPTHGDFQAHCQRAMQVAGILAKTYVPLAGGHPYPKTPQQPTAAMLKGASACDVVDSGSIVYANDMADDNPETGTTAQGTTCDYTSEQQYGRIQVLLTTGSGGLAALPAKPGTQVSTTRLGVLHARTEQRADGCTFSVQFENGQVAQLDYTVGEALTDERYRQTSCISAQLAMAGSVMHLMSNQ